MKRNIVVMSIVVFVLTYGLIAVTQRAYEDGYHAGRQSMWEEATAIGCACWDGDPTQPIENQVREYQWVRPNGSDRAEVTQWRLMLQEKKALADFVKSITFEHKPVHVKDFQEKPGLYH